MKPIGILYATREGHTRTIAEHLASALQNLGLASEVHNLRTEGDRASLNAYAGVILAASVHAGRHEPEMTRFVRKNREPLELMPAAFLSVTLSEAGVERPDATERQHAQFVADVQKVLGNFFAETEWQPHLVKPVAGALLYSRYNFLIRFVMKQIAKKAGADTDTSRDYVYTDWLSLDQFANEFAAALPKAAAGAQ